MYVCVVFVEKRKRREEAEGDEREMLGGERETEGKEEARKQISRYIGQYISTYDLYL